MASCGDQELEFLDLTDIDEAERDRLQQLLYTITPNLELPWEVQNQEPCVSQEFEPTQFAADPPNGPAVGLVPPIDSLECTPGSIVASNTPPAGHLQSHGSGAGEGAYSSENSPMQILSVSPSASSTVPPSTQPVMTTMYQMVGHPTLPLSNVYVGNVTANVNVHSFVGPSLTPFNPHMSQQQVFSPNEMPLPPEVSGSPSTGRNGLGQRRSRGNKSNNKRPDGQFTPRSPGINHGHDALAPAVVESPTGPPPLPQNYMFPVPPIHHAFPQPFYQPPPQPPHGTHLPQHPSAQHATGPPLFLPMFPAPMYNTYHQPAGGIMYSTNPQLVPAPVATTEHSSVIAYQVNEAPSERMVPEGRETDVAVHKPQNIYENEAVPLKDSINGEEKIVNYIHHDSDTETCTLASTVVVNNSNMIPNVTFPDDGYKNEMPAVNTVSEIPENQVSEENFMVENSCSVDEKAPTVSIVNELPSVSPKLYQTSPDVMEKVAEKKDYVVSASSSDLTPVEKPPNEVKVNGICATTPKPTADNAATLLPSSASKVNSSNSPFPQPSGVGDSTPAPSVTPNPGEKTWASLFNKSSRSLPSDGPMILATGLTASNAASKPLAAVRPFQNAVTVVSGAGDTSRKTNDAPPVSADFPRLGQSDLPAPSMADDPHLYRLGELLSKYQLDHRAISLQPRGLTNRSNWCYINSTLQALLACPPFYNLMKALSVPSRRSSKSSTPIIDSMVEFVNEFGPLSPVSRVNRKEKAQRKDDTIEVQVGAAFEPSYIYKMLSNIQSDTFKVEGRQEDAEEFFSCLLNALNDEMLELMKLVKDTTVEGSMSNGDVSGGDGGNQNYEDDDNEWKVMGKKNKGSVTRRAEFERTPVSDIFRGQLRSRVQRAGDYSDNVQPFFTLQLDIEKAQSVKDALDLLVGRDQLEGVTCSRTNQEVEAWQQVSLEELPLVLVLHLKWFNYKLDGCSKIVKSVEFPIDLKVDGKLMSTHSKYNPKQKQYKLFAVVYHDGKEATKGHYITDVYHVGYGGWVRYDDSSVKAIQEAQMLHPRGSRVPYLLYYRRCDTIGNITATPDKSR